MTVIPVIAIPHLNRPDLLLRAIRSIDVEVERLVIIQNGKDADMPSASEIGRPFIHIKTPQGGFAGSVNLAIKLFPAFWWVILSNDVELARGDLDIIKSNVTRFYRTAGVVLGNQAYAYFAVTALAVREVGLFDENFYPAYMEDKDYERRILLSGMHEYWSQGCYATHEGGGGNAVRSNPNLRFPNSKSFQENLKYYAKKWGGFPDNIFFEGQDTVHEQYKTPFNRDVPLSFWEFDPDMRRRTLWEKQ